MTFLRRSRNLFSLETTRSFRVPTGVSATGVSKGHSPRRGSGRSPSSSFGLTKSSRTKGCHRNQTGHECRSRLPTYQVWTDGVKILESSGSVTLTLSPKNTPLNGLRVHPTLFTDNSPHSSWSSHTTLGKYPQNWFREQNLSYRTGYPSELSRF